MNLHTTNSLSVASIKVVVRLTLVTELDARHLAGTLDDFLDFSRDPDFLYVDVTSLLPTLVFVDEGPNRIRQVG